MHAPTLSILLAALLLLSAVALCAAPAPNPEQQNAADAQARLGSVAPLKPGRPAPLPPGIKRQLRMLWDLAEPRKAPFAVEILSTKTEDGYRTDELTFTSRVTLDGPDRIFCTFSRPEKTDPPFPVYINLTGGRAPEGVLWLARHYRGAVLDIEWRSPDLKHHTKWARPSSAGLFGLKDPLADDFNAMWATAIRRAIDFLQEQTGVDRARIACGGGSMGGWYSLLTAGLDTRVACVYDFYATGNAVAAFLNALTPEQHAVWLAAFDPLTYAKNIKAPTLMYLGTNDYFFSLSHGMTHYNRLAGEKRMLILPNCNHHFGFFGQRLPEVDKAWIDHCFHGEPAFPTVTEPSARGRTYRWKAAGPYPIERATLCWSPGSSVWPARYWLELPAERRGDSWVADVPQEYASLSAVLYATVFDEKGRGVSSRIVTRKGLDPLTTAGPLWPGGALWDVERGAAAWRRPGPGPDNAFWPQTVVAVSPAGIRVTPDDPANKLSIITNSVVLASGRAAEYAGIQVVIDGGGHAGELTLRLERESGIVRGVAYAKRFAYGPGSTTVRIPWSELKGPAGAPIDPFPFDGLRVDGDRAKGATITFEEIELYR